MLNFNASTSPGASLRSRTDALVALFSRVAQTRMAGVPILNPALRVEALGFELCEAATAPLGTPTEAETQALEIPGAVGVLVTPWFMNLVWFPLAKSDQADGVGRSHLRQVGAECFDFIGGYEPGFGHYEACSLFSPMFEFTNPAAARATAQAVLATLRQPVVTAPVVAPGPIATPPAPPVQPAELAARRAFLFGRRPTPEGSV